MTITHTTCCGMCQAGGLEEYTSAKEAMKEMAKGFFTMTKSIMLFSCSTKSRTGLGVVKLIQDNKLGEVMETEPEDHGEDKVRVFVWNVDSTKLHVWYSEVYEGWKAGDKFNGTPELQRYAGLTWGQDATIEVVSVSPSFNSLRLRNNATGQELSTVPLVFVPAYKKV